MQLSLSLFRAKLGSGRSPLPGLLVRAIVKENNDSSNDEFRCLIPSKYTIRSLIREKKTSENRTGNVVAVRISWVPPLLYFMQFTVELLLTDTFLWWTSPACEWELSTGPKQTIHFYLKTDLEHEPREARLLPLLKYS